MFDASSLVGALLKADSVPERAFLHAAETNTFALSAAVAGEVSNVLNRPRFMRVVLPDRRERLWRVLTETALWFDPATRVDACRDVKDNKYLELALSARAEIVVSSDNDLIVLDTWSGIRIVSPAAYLSLVGVSNDE